jgi:hypothetical protein
VNRTWADILQGGSSGTVFVRRMREQMGGLLGDGDRGAPFLPRLPRPYPAVVFNSPGSTHDSPFESGLPNTIDLPSKEVALHLCDNALNLACSLLCFVHQPSFYRMVDKIYDIPVESYGNEENQFLPLLYVVLALGCLFNLEGNDPPTYKSGIDHGCVTLPLLFIRPHITASIIYASLKIFLVL